MREQARALTGWTQRLGRRRRPRQLPLRPAAATTTGTKTIFGQTRQLRLARLVPARASTTPPTRRYFVAQALVLLHPGAAAARGRRRRSSSSTSSAATRSARVVEAILMHPTSTRARAMVKPPIVYIAGHAARAPARHRQRRLGRGSPTWPASGLFRPAERRRLGRDALARHRRPSAGAGSRPARSPARRDRRRGPTTPTRRPDAAVDEGAAVLGQPDAQRRRRKRARALRRARSQAATDADWEQETYRALRQNALRMLIATSPDIADLLRARAATAAATSSPRRSSLRRAVAEAGQGLPAIEPGMPPPAGTGLDRRSFLLRSGAAMLSVYGASQPRPRRFEEGIAQAAGRHRARCSSRSSSRAASTRSRCSRRSTTPSTSRCARRWRCRPAPGTAFTEDPRLQLASRRGRASTTFTGAGKITVLPAIGYDDPNQSHFTSRHYWEVGGLLPTRRHRLDGPAARPRSAPPTTRSRASRSTARSRRRSRTADVPVAAIDGPALRPLGPGRLGRGRGPDVRRASATLGARRRGDSDPGCRAGRAAPRRRCSCAAELQPFSDGAITPPVAYPDGEDDGSPSSLAALAAMLAAGLPIRCAALSAPGSYDTHDDQAEDFDPDLSSPPTRSLAFQARPRGPGARRPRRHPGLVGVRPPPGGERLGHRSRRRRRRAS